MCAGESLKKNNPTSKNVLKTSHENNSLRRGNGGATVTTEPKGLLNCGRRRGFEN